MTILTLAFAAVVVQRRLEDQASITGSSDFMRRQILLTSNEC